MRCDYTGTFFPRTPVFTTLNDNNDRHIRSSSVFIIAAIITVAVRHIALRGVDYERCCCDVCYAAPDQWRTQLSSTVDFYMARMTIITLISYDQVLFYFSCEAGKTKAATCHAFPENVLTVTKQRSFKRLK